MKRAIIFAILGCIVAATAWAQAPVQANKQMQSLAYGSAIDQKVAFYQKRIYLADSEYKILADIGKDAVNRIAYLKSNRQQIVSNMLAENVQLKDSSLNAFMVGSMSHIQTTMEAYSDQ